MGFLMNFVWQTGWVRDAVRKCVVGDGFPIPLNSQIRIWWDGKPVPYKTDQYRVLLQPLIYQPITVSRKDGLPENIIKLLLTIT